MARTKDEIADAGGLGNFTKAMKEKLRIKRFEGRGGWWKKKPAASSADIYDMMMEHGVRARRDHRQLVDVANFVMFLHERHVNAIEKAER